MIENPEMRNLAVQSQNDSIVTTELIQDQISLLLNYYATVLFAWDAYYASLRAGLINNEDLVFLESYVSNDFFSEQWSF